MIVAGSVDQIQAKSPAKWSVQIIEIILGHTLKDPDLKTC